MYSPRPNGRTCPKHTHTLMHGVLCCPAALRRRAISRPPHHRGMHRRHMSWLHAGGHACARAHTQSRARTYRHTRSLSHTGTHTHTVSCGTLQPVQLVGTSGAANTGHGQANRSAGAGGSCTREKGSCALAPLRPSARAHPVAQGLYGGCS